MSTELSTTSAMKPEKRKCSRIKRNGEPCGLAPIRGGTTCHKHGGANRFIREAANQRLLALLDPALAQLRRIVIKKDTSDADRLRAIAMIMDRTGLSAELVVKELSLQIHAEAKQTAEAESPWGKLLEGIVAEVSDGGAGLGWSHEDQDAVEQSNREQHVEDDDRVIRGEVIKDEPKPLPPAPPASAPDSTPRRVVPTYLSRLTDDDGGARWG